MNTLLDRLETVAKRYEELNQILMDPSIANDVKKMTDASKEQGSLEKAYGMYKEYKSLLDGIEESKSLLGDSDPDIKEMAKMELEELQARKPELEREI
ncbi:MAG TPA: peptide chain release factor 1, partial [Erysipelotrichaceae bacterium]|nr:peptide chain release factor 1 [Erysipelotrichaceae bacterium]